MSFVYFTLALILVWFSFRSFRGGVNYLNFFRKELAKPPSDWEPIVTIIAPCKGVDDGMLTNFEALLDQDLPEYEIIFVVDDLADQAADIIEPLRDRSERPIKLVVASKATESSQKVGNLREGVLHAHEKSEAFVFIDSDARPSPGWLRALVAPLRDDGIGAATGYRWFISDRPTLASELRSAWNASIASALGPNEQSNFCWGGSVAIRRDKFENLNIRDRWHGTLSDDYTVTRVIKEVGLGIRFVPRALTASVGNCTFGELLEFTTRQMQITRVYAPKLWLMSFIGSGLFCAVMVASFPFIVLNPQNTIEVWVAIAVLALVAVFSVGKAALRLNAVRLALPQYAETLHNQRFTQYTLWFVAPAIFFLNCLVALFSKTIIWRGTKYEMISASETRVE